MSQIGKFKAAIAAFAYPLAMEASKNVPVLAPVVGLVVAAKEATKKLEINPHWAIPNITEALVGSELSAADKETVMVMTISALNQAVLEEVGSTARYTPEEFADRAMEEAERQGLDFGEHKELVRRLMKAFFEAYLAHEDVFNAIGPEKLAEVTEELQRIDRELDGRIWDIYRNASLQDAWRNSVYLLDALAPAEKIGFEAIKTKGGVLRFVETRDFWDTLKQLKEVKESGKRKIFVMHGAGGHGKTRLWSELGLRLVRDGWRGGFLRPGDSFDSLSTIFTAETRPLFLVVDYALSRATDFKNIIDAAAGSGWGGALALVLLDRQEVKYVENYRKEQNDPRGSGFRRWLQGVEDAGPVKLRELTEDEAKKIFFGAFADLEKLNGGAASNAEDVWRGYAAGLKKRPLHLVLYAYLAVVGALERFSTEEDLFEAAINYEVGHWLQAIGVEGDAVPHYEGSLKRMAAVATLAGAIPKDEALRHAGSGCVLEGEAEHYVEQVKLRDALAKMLPCEVGGECIGALEPDPIADYMLNDLLEQDNFECLVEAALPPEGLADDAQFFARVKHVADVLARAFNQSQAYEMLRPVFVSRDPRYAVRVWEMMERWQGVGREELRLDPNAPLVTHVLFPLVLSIVVEYGKKLSGESIDDAEWARLFSMAGSALVAHGYYHEALDPAQRAAELYQQLADKNPTRFLPYLATSLNNLANRLSDLGRHQEALESAQKAVGLYRQLVDQNPTRFLPDLATSLNNLATFLSDLGRHPEALEPAQKAVELRQQLAEKDPTRFLPNLAASLNNLALIRSNIGRHQEALEPAQKAVELRRRLADQNPTRFLPDLAMSLNNLANILSDLGRHPEALEPAERAVQLRQQLANQNPIRFLPDLAASLNNLANRLSNLGRHQEALEPAQKAVELRQRLAEENPTRFNPDLANVLGLTAHILNAAGRYQEAFSKAEEALRKLKDHFFHLPQAYAGLIMAILTIYENAREHCGCEPDMELVNPIIEKLQELQG